jgi:hypothetical protein
VLEPSKPQIGSSAPSARIFVFDRKRAVGSVPSIQMYSALNVTSAPGRLVTVLPALQSAVDLARSSYRDGGAPYFLVLETTTQYFDAQESDVFVLSGAEGEVRAVVRGVNHGVDRTGSWWPRATCATF